MLLVLITATWVFGTIAEDVVTHDPLTIMDLRFNAWLHSHSSASLTRLMLLIGFVHSGLCVTVITLAVSVYLWLRQLRRWALTLILAVFGGMLLNASLKILFARPRPYFVNPSVTLTSFSFPSGHTMTATVFYGTLCLLTWFRARSRRLRMVAILITGFMIMLVGFSRLYLGAHYLSDVVAAFAEGLAWLAFCLVAIEAASLRRAHR
jgi:undecaprenyl-diphosphatase